MSGFHRFANLEKRHRQMQRNMKKSQEAQRKAGPPVPVKIQLATPGEHRASDGKLYTITYEKLEES